jgi:hypothetical protein
MRMLKFVALCTLLLTAGCYSPISGTVIDAETKQPIEGAVILVEWTKTKGVGLTYTESYKVAETVTDKDGNFELPGCYSPFVNAPDVTVYKKGYVAWSSRNIFPGYEKRTDFKWGSGYVFKMEHFKDTYSYTDHQSFISRAINDTIGWESKKTFIRVYDEAERDKIIKEQNKKDMERMRGPQR